MKKFLASLLVVAALAAPALAGIIYPGFVCAPDNGPCCDPNSTVCCDPATGACSGQSLSATDVALTTAAVISALP